MPAMSGPALCAELLADRPGLRVLFMSGYAEGAIVEHGVLEHGAYFLPKPFSVPGLLRRVREILDQAG